MAIIVPILVSYGATALGYAATTATMLATATSVAFQVTGVNNKINKAAAKVFGEDLVMIANIAGAVYGAVNGGFTGGGGEAAGLTEAGGALSTKAMLDGTNAFGSNSAVGAFNLADAAGGMTNVADSLAATTDSLGNSTYTPGDMNGVELSAVGPAKGVNLLDGGQPLGVDTKMQSMSPPPAAAPITGQTGAAAPTAAGSNAAAPTTTQTATQAPTGQELKQTVTNPASKPLAAKAGSFFDKLLSNDKAVGEIIKGVGGGISGAANAKAEKDKLDWAKKRYTNTATTRIVQ